MDRYSEREEGFAKSICRRSGVVVCICPSYASNEIWGLVVRLFVLQNDTRTCKREKRAMEVERLERRILKPGPIKIGVKVRSHARMAGSLEGKRVGPEGLGKLRPGANLIRC